MFDLKKFRIEKKITQDELASMLGCKQGFISQVEKGKSKIPADWMEKLNISYGNEIEEYIIDDIHPLDKKSSTDLSNELLIRYYDLDASAGLVEMFDSGNASSFKDILVPGFSDCEIALNVWGDSMVPVLKSGDIVLLKEWRERFIEYGQIYLVTTKENNRMIKYLHPGFTDDTVSCVSANPFFKPVEVYIADILKLFMVKGHISRSSV
jgi:phage repressor protein C with HTH and peptisase S24 domain